MTTGGSPYRSTCQAGQNGWSGHPEQDHQQDHEQDHDTAAGRHGWSSVAVRLSRRRIRRPAPPRSRRSPGPMAAGSRRDLAVAARRGYRQIGPAHRADPRRPRRQGHPRLPVIGGRTGPGPVRGRPSARPAVAGARCAVGGTLLRGRHALVVQTTLLDQPRAAPTAASRSRRRGKPAPTRPARSRRGLAGSTGWQRIEPARIRGLGLPVELKSRSNLPSPLRLSDAETQAPLSGVRHRGLELLEIIGDRPVGVRPDTAAVGVGASWNHRLIVPTLAKNPSARAPVRVGERVEHSSGDLRRQPLAAADGSHPGTLRSD